MFKLVCDNREKKVLSFIKKELDKKTTYSLMKDYYLNVDAANLENRDFEVRIGNEIACACIISRLDEEYEQPMILYENEQLKVGDYVITHGENNYPLAVIERKTLSDFSYSIKDKRHYNYEKLLRLREMTGCKIFYFIEGNIEDLKYSSSIAGIKFFNIFSSFLSLQLKYDIHIIYTKNENDTARKLKFLAEKTASLYLKGELEIKVSDSNLVECMNNCDFTEEEKLRKNVYKMWMVIPQIGSEASKKLSSKYSIKDYIMGNLVELDELKLNNKQIISLNKKPNEQQIINILASVPGLSKTKATKILTCVRIENLIENTVSNKIPGLGKKTMDTIVKYMNLKITEQNIDNSNIENVVSDNLG